MKSEHTRLPLPPADESGRLQIPDKLYGREQAAGSLLAAFERVCCGRGEVLVLPGRSGVGKTALAQSVRGPVEMRNGFFLAGKFNQFQQNVPYFAIRQALTQLCQKLGKEDDVQLQHWKSSLLQAVGSHGQLLVDLVPELESLLGRQPPMAAISALEARHRLAGVFREFFKALCRPEHPVVLFIDDCQWADSASLDLLERLQVGSALRYLLVIASYRNNEVDDSHPLAAALAGLRRQAVPVEAVEIFNLAVKDVRELLADTLKPLADHLDGLAELLCRRTAGNPFFLRAFLTFLYEQRLLWLDPSHGSWHCNLREIGESELPADAVQLFAGKLAGLSPSSRKLLVQAACLGNRFDLSTLELISDLSADQARSTLAPALAQGLVLPVDDAPLPGGIQFLHDQVQQAAYSLIPAEELPKFRLEIGRLLLARFSPEQLSERALQVADHLNAGQPLIQDPEEQVRVVEVNMRAARKAREATAYRTALQFHRATAFFLSLPGFAERFWRERHDLAFPLFLERAESEFLEGDRGEAEHCVQQAVAHAACAIEKAEALNVLIVQFTLLARYPEAIAAAREALAALGIRLPEDDYEAARDIEIARVRQRLIGRTVADLIALPVMSDPEMRTATKLLIAMGPPCYRSHQRLWSVIVPKVVNLTLDYGHIPQIGYSHPAFGGLLSWVENDYAMAKEFGDLATHLMASTFDSPSDQSVFYLMIGSSMRHWIEHLKSSSRDYAMAYEMGLRSGNLQYAAYAFGHNMYCRLYQGTPLPELIQESRQSLAFSRTRVNQWAIDLLEGGLSVFGALEGTDAGLDDEAWEGEYLRQVEEHHNIQITCIYFVIRAFSLLVLGQFKQALEWSEKADALIYTVGTQGLLPWPEHVFARLLIITALYAEAEPARQVGWRADLDRMLEQLRIWAETCPENFAHKHALAAAELARLDGRIFEAMRLYHQAAEAAAGGGFVQWEGLANERAAAFWESLSCGRLAQVHWKQAYICYHRWGAAAKLRAMEAAYLDHLSFDLPDDAEAGTSAGGSQEIPQDLLKKYIALFRTQAAGAAQFKQRDLLERQAEELAEGSERLRVEISERKRVEEQLRQHREHLEEIVNQRTAELVGKNTALERFTYTVSHDLRTPLVTIKTFLGYLEKDLNDKKSESVAKDLGFIHRAADKMVGLLDDLLKLARVGHNDNAPVEVSVQEIAKAAIDIVGGQIAERGVQVEVTEKPIWLTGDRDRLVEVFQNLLDNAVKFLGRQPLPRVEIGAEQQDGKVVLFVRDNGSGIDPRYQAKVFGLFEKLDASAPGSGMGLALVRRIVELHGGKIWVQSEGLGRGSTFRFTLSKTQLRQPEPTPSFSLACSAPVSAAAPAAS